MDLMNLLRSVEALLYEVVSWMVFYPLTLWRCIVRPIRMALYAEQELTQAQERQFEGALSPPLFLFLTLLIAHALQLRFGSSHGQLPGLLADERVILLFRAVLFSLFPLLFAIQRVRQTGQELTRSSLRPAFYGQCYLAVPFALTVDVSLVVVQAPHGAAVLAGLILFAAATGWYLTCLTRWFTYHGVARWPRAFGRALATVVLGLLAFLAIATAVALATVSQ